MKNSTNTLILLIFGGFLSLFPLALGATGNTSNISNELKPVDVNINKENKKSSLEKTVSYIEAKKNSQKKSSTFYEGGNDGNGQDRIEGDRYIHITPEGKTIVSWATQSAIDKFYENMEQIIEGSSLKDGLEYDPVNPIFGVVPEVPGADPSERSPLLELILPADKKFTLEQRIQSRGLFNEQKRNWDCGQFATQNAHIDGFGIYDIINSGLTTGENKDPYDYSTNGDFEAPTYLVSTRTTSGVAHAVCGMFLGKENPSENNLEDFSQWYFWEPQTGEEIKPGDYSFNDHAYVEWFGKTKDFLGNWLYDSQTIIKFTNINDNPESKDKHPSLKESWNPGEKATTEGDKDIEIYQGIENDYEALAGEVQNKYPQTLEETVVTSGQVMNGGPEQTNYDVLVLRNLTAGIYNSQNTVDMIKNQTLRIRDTTPPNADGTDNSGFPAELVQEVVKSNETCDGLVYTKTTEQFYKDMAGNVLNLENIVEEIDETVMPECTNIADTLEITGHPDETSYHPDDLENGWGQWSHPTNDLRFEYSSEILHEAYGEKDVKNKITAYSNRSDCEVADTSYVVKIRSAVGISDLSNNKHIQIYPNPASSFINIKIDESLFLSSPNVFEIRISDINGMVYTRVIPAHPTTRIPLKSLPTGTLLLQIYQNGKLIAVKKIIKASGLSTISTAA